MKKFFIFITILATTFCIFSACGNAPENPAVATTTPIIHNMPVQPHGEKTYEEMISFINTVDENTFQDGQFKSAIDRVREENYIIRPLYDGNAATFADREPNFPLYIEPYYKHADYPPQFMYHFEDDGYKYRINVIYIDEAYIDDADDYGFSGYYHFLNGGTKAEWKKTKAYKTLSHKKIHIDGKKCNVTLQTLSEDKSTQAFFVWGKYLIKVVGDHIENERAYDVCNTDILTHLSFEKVPLKQRSSPNFCWGFFHP